MHEHLNRTFRMTIFLDWQYFSVLFITLIHKSCTYITFIFRISHLCNFEWTLACGETVLRIGIGKLREIQLNNLFV